MDFDNHGAPGSTLHITKNPQTFEGLILPCAWPWTPWILFFYHSVTKPKIHSSYFALKQNQEVKDDYEDEKPDLAKLVAQSTNSYRLKFNVESPRVQTVPFVKLDHSVSPGMVQS